MLSYLKGSCCFAPHNLSICMSISRNELRLEVNGSISQSCLACCTVDVVRRGEACLHYNILLCGASDDICRTGAIFVRIESIVVELDGVVMVG